MVDSISGPGNVQAPNATAKKVLVLDEAKKAKDVLRTSDEVSISNEARELQDAERTAADTKTQLAADQSATLGIKADFEE